MFEDLVDETEINRSDLKETYLEMKVKELEKEMINLDCRLENEKLLLKTKVSEESTVRALTDTFLPYIEGTDCNLEMGDDLDPWQVKPVEVHHYNFAPRGEQPSIFFTWNCSAYDFHNNSSQRSIYTLIDLWKPGENTMSVDQFKNKLSALLAVNSEVPPQLKDVNREEFEESEMDYMDLFFHQQGKLEDSETRSTHDYLDTLSEESPLPENPFKIKQFISNDNVINIFEEPLEGQDKKSMKLPDITKEMEKLNTIIKSFNLDQSLLANIPLSK